MDSLNCNIDMKPSTMFGGMSVKFDGSNFPLWSQSMRLFLGSYGKDQHITQAPPISTDPSYEAWRRADMAVLNTLINSMTPTVASTIMYQQSAKGAWDFLNSTYAPQQNLTRVFRLYEEIINLKQEDRSFQELYTILQGKWDELSQYHPPSTNIEVILQQR